ncbi:MAG TPA: hypothetical protein VM432_04540 [Bdellovibrionales bacterium]|nr:hypothetical protein [Bdellovibrionales bacterium]
MSKEFTSKEPYIADFRSELDRIAPRVISEEQIENFIAEISDHFDAQERKGQTVFAITYHLGSPSRLAHAFAAYAVVRSRRPAFKWMGRLRLSTRNVNYMLFSSPGRSLWVSISSLLLSVIPILTWILAIAFAVSGVAGLVSLVVKLNLSRELEIGAAFFFAGLIFFAYPIAIIADGVSSFFASLLWDVARSSASRHLENLTGEPR